MENLEFDDLKKVRKSLLITCVISIFLNRMIKYSTGDFKFLGFSIELKEADFIPELLGFIVVFYLFALLIRYYNDDFLVKYKSKLDSLPDSDLVQMFMNAKNHGKYENHEKKVMLETYKRLKKMSWTVLFLDLIFPILLALFTLADITCFNKF